MRAEPLVPKGGVVAVLGRLARFLGAQKVNLNLLPAPAVAHSPSLKPETPSSAPTCTHLYPLSPLPAAFSTCSLPLPHATSEGSAVFLARPTCLHTSRGPAPSPGISAHLMPWVCLLLQLFQVPGCTLSPYHACLIPLYPQCLAWCCAHMTSVKMPGTLEKE